MVTLYGGFGTGNSSLWNRYHCRW